MYLACVWVAPEGTHPGFPATSSECGCRLGYFDLQHLQQCRVAILWHVSFLKVRALKFFENVLVRRRRRQKKKQRP